LSQEIGNAGKSSHRVNGLTDRTPPERPPRHPKGQFKESAMLYWALVFFIVAIVAGFFGFGGVASASAGIAQILFFIFLVLLVVSLIMHLVRGRRGSM
jgi:uncharacterized membrane protein YtjA (UPF0391 family)